VETTNSNFAFIEITISYNYDKFLPVYNIFFVEVPATDSIGELNFETVSI